MMLEDVLQIQLSGKRIPKLLLPRFLMSYSVEHKLRVRSTSLRTKTEKVLKPWSMVSKIVITKLNYCFDLSR